MEHEESRFGFFTRRRLEKQIIYGSWDKNKPQFLVAYKIFVDALAQKDLATLKKMSESKVYSQIIEDYADIDAQNW